MKKLKRILALILVLVLFTGDLGINNFMTLPAYADDAAAVGDSVSDAPSSDDAAAPVGADALGGPSDNAGVLDVPTSDDAAAPVGADALGGPSDNADVLDVPTSDAAPAYAERTIEKIKLAEGVEMRLTGMLPEGAAVKLEKTIYELKKPEECRELLYRCGLKVTDAKGEEIEQSGKYILEISGKSIEKLIKDGTIADLRLVYDWRNHEAKQLPFGNTEEEQAKAKDTVRFELTKLELFVLYLWTEAPVTDDSATADAPSDAPAAPVGAGALGGPSDNDGALDVPPAEETSDDAPAAPVGADALDGTSDNDNAPAAEIELVEYTLDAPLWASETVYLTGLLPVNAVACAVPVTVELEGMIVLAAYDITIYASPEAEASGDEWQPDENAVTVHFADVQAEEDKELEVYHIPDETEEPELVATVTPDESGEISFEASGFSVYVVTTLKATITASDGVSYDISVSYDTAAGFTEPVELSVTELGGEDFETYLKAAAEALNVSAEQISYVKIFDISIVGKLSGTVYEPAAPVEVKIRALEADESELLDIVHFGASTEVIEAAEPGNSASFTTNSFSIYAAAITPRITFNFYRDLAKTEEYTFKLESSSQTTNRQIVRDGESLVMPQLPESGSQTFLGWYRIDNGEQQKFGEAISVSTSATVDLYAKFGNVVYVTFLGEGDGGQWPVCFTRSAVLEGASVEIKISDITTSPRSNTEVFRGWTTVEADARFKNEASMISTDKITISSNTRLYPVFADAYWLRFSSGENGNGASYQAPQYQLTGHTDNSLPTVTRTGYTFDGWYDSYDRDTGSGTGTPVTNADGTVLENVSIPGVAHSDEHGNLTLEANITLYARWTPQANTRYTVVYWLQRVTDDTGLASNKKTYDYVDAKTDYTAATGATVSLGTYDRDPARVGGSGTKYVFNSANSTPDNTEVVKADGSTVLNAYFDRSEVTLTFQLPNVTESGGVYTGTVDGTSVRVFIDSTRAYYLTLNGAPYTGSVYGYNNGYVNDGYPITNYSYYDTVNDRAAGVYSNSAVYLRTQNGTYLQWAEYTDYYTVHTITGLYGQNISDEFEKEPLKTYREQGYTWEDSLHEVYLYILSTVEEIPEKDVVFHGGMSGRAETIYYYVESLDQTSGESATRKLFTAENVYREINGADRLVGEGGEKYFELHKTVYHNYNFLTYDEEFHEIEGFEKTNNNAVPYFGQPGKYSHSDRTFTNLNLAPIGGFNTSGDTTETNVNYLYYLRTVSKLTLRKADNTVIDDTRTFKYGETITPPADLTDDAYAPQRNAGYEFTGWYADQACTTRVFFSEAEADEKKESTKDDEGNYHYVVISTMPAEDISVFAGWKQKKYPVTIDPDGGILSDTEATYFNAAYGELILEYNDVTRPYVEIDPAESYAGDRYYYWYDTRELNQLTGNSTRMAYYYPTSQGEKPQTRRDSSNNLVEYKPNDSTYSLVGWYRLVNGKLELFDFNTKTTSATTLQAVWRKTGTWWVKYDAANGYNGGTGTIKNNDTPAEFVQLTTPYADGSTIVIDRVAETASDSEYQFVGWHIKGDTTDTIYYPNEGFVYRSAFADSSNVLTLEAVYEVVHTTSVTYDANGGSGTLTDGGKQVEGAARPALTLTDNTVNDLELNSEIILSSGAGFTRRSYRLIGWSSNPARTENDFDPAAHPDTDFSITVDPSTGEAPHYVADDPAGTTLYAVWERTYAIVYDPNGGGGGALAGLTSNGDGKYIHTGIIKNTDAAVTDKTFTRSGYVQIGWSTNAAQTAEGFNAASNITDYAAGDTISNIAADVTLYAVWEARYELIYNVSPSNDTLYNPSGLTNNGDRTFTTGRVFASGEKVTLSTGTANALGSMLLSRSGYVLTGWTTEPNGGGTHHALGEANFEITGNTTLYAEWTRLLSVTYNANGGSGTLANGGSWTYNSVTTTLTPAANVVTGIPNGASLTLSTGATSGGLLTRPDYTLIGWDTDPSATTPTYTLGKTNAFILTTETGVPNSERTNAQGNLTLYAVWRQKLQITYDVNANDAVGVLRGLVNNNDNTFTTGRVYEPNQTGITLHDATLTDGTSTLSRPGYMLLGWNTNAAGTGTHYDLGATGYALSAADVTLYAVWTPVYTLTYAPNGGTGALTDGGLLGATPAVLVNKGDGTFLVTDILKNTTVTVSDGTGFLRDGYRQIGWATSAERANAGTVDYKLDSAPNTFPITADTTLYAVWQKLFMVTYYANGGSGTLTDGGSAYYDSATHTLTPRVNVVSDIPDGSTVTVSDGTGFSREGYRQLGWATTAAKAETGTVEYDADAATTSIDDHFTISADVELYAVWEHLIQIVYDRNGGTGTLSDPADIVFIGADRFTTDYTLVKGDPVTLSSGAGLSRTGYALAGWATTKARADAGTVDYTKSQSIAALDAPAVTITDNTVTLFAVWEPLLTVTYDPNGGEGALTNGGSAYYDSAAHTLTPVASGAAYVVSGIPSGSVVTVSTGATYTRRGFTFKGWATTKALADAGTVEYDTDAATTSIDDHFTLNQSDTVNGNLTLYAVWTAGTTLTLVNNTGMALSGIDVTLPTASGMTTTDTLSNISLAVGASTTISVTVPPATMAKIAANTATPDEKEFTVSGTNATGQKLVLESSLTGMGTAIRRSAEASGLTGYELIDSFSADAGVTVTFTLDVPRTLNLHANYSGGTDQTETFMSADESYSLPAFSREGHIFQGWATSSGGSVAYNAGELLTLSTFFGSSTSKDLYAVWQAPSNASGTVRVYKNVTGDGDRTTDFTFTIKFSGSYEDNYTVWRPDSGTITEQTRSVTLKNGESLAVSVTQTQHPGKLVITYVKYNINGGQNSSTWTVWDSARSDVLFIPRNYSFSGTVTIEETVPSGYTATNNRSNSTFSSSAGNTVTYTDLSASGNIVFNNNHVATKHDLTVEKTLVDPLMSSDTFSFEARVEYNHNVSTRNFTVSSLSGSNSYVLEDVPEGASVTITETAADQASLADFDTAASGVAGGSLSGRAYTFTMPTADATVTFTNTRRTVPAVTVTKTVVNPTLTAAQINALSFRVRATLKTPGGIAVANYAVKDGSGNTIVTDANGCFDFTITPAAGVSLKLPASAKLYFTEISHSGCADPDVYTLTASSPTMAGNLTNGFTVVNGGSVALTNTVKSTTVTLTKSMENGTTADNTTAFTFTPELFMADGTTALTYGNFTGGTNNNAYSSAVSLANGQSRSFTVPIGAVLKLTETVDTDKYSVAASASENVTSASLTDATYTLTVPKTASTVTFTNTRNTVKVRVYKVLDDPFKDGSESFSVTATLTEGGSPVTNYLIRGTNRTNASGEHSFNISESAYVELTVPYGAKLELAEASTESLWLDSLFTGDAYALTVAASGTNASANSAQRKAEISAAVDTTPYTVTFTNSRKLVRVRVEKDVDDPLAPDTGFIFTGTIKWSDHTTPLTYWNVETGTKEADGTTGANITDADGRITFTLTDDRSTTGTQYYKVLKIPAGSYLEGRETNAALYMTVITYSGTKYLDGAADNSMKMMVLDPSTNLPTTNPPTYSSSFSFPTATVPGTDPKAYTSDIPPWDSWINFTNTRRTTTVNVVKALQNGTPSDAAQSFSFKAELFMANGTDPLTYGDFTTGTNSNEYSFSRIGAGTAASLTVPIGAVVKITETVDSNRYAVTAGGVTGAVLTSDLTTPDAATYTYTIDGAPANTSTVTFTNTRKQVTVTVSKQLIDLYQDGSETFRVTATLTESVGSVETGVNGYPIHGANATDASGVYAFDLSGSSPVTLTVPYGAKLTLAEDMQRQTFRNRYITSLYETDYTTDGGTNYTDSNSVTFSAITADEEVEFRNARKIVIVNVEKETHDPLNEDRAFSFTAVLMWPNGVTPLAYYDLTSGEQKDVTYYNGLTPEQKKSCTDANGEAVFDLSNGQSKALRMPAGTIMTGYETNAGLYSTDIIFEGVKKVNGTPVSDIEFLPADPSDPPPTDFAPITIPNDRNPFGHAQYGPDTIPPFDSTFTFINTKPYVAVTVTKTLDDPLTTANPTFDFTLEILDRNNDPVAIPATSWSYNDGTTTRTTTLDSVDAQGKGLFSIEIDVEHGETQGEFVLYLPVGAHIKISEDAVTHYATTVDGVSTSFAENNNLQSAVTYAFTNTRKSVPVTIMKIDDHDETLTGSVFRTTTPTVIKTGEISSGGSGTIFSGELYYAAVLALTEDQYPTNYGKSSPANVSVTVSATGAVTVTDGNSVTANPDGSYTVYIRNTRNTHTLTVSKTLHDLILPSATFAFTVSVTEQDGTPIANYKVYDDAEDDTRDITTDANGLCGFSIENVADNATLSKTITVPEGARVEITEVLTDDQDGVYSTAVDGAATNVKLFENVQTDGTTSFVNTRMPSRVFVRKTLSDPLAASAYSFTYTVKLEKPDGSGGWTPLVGYDTEHGCLAADYAGTSNSAYVTNASGELGSNITLSVANGGTSAEFRLAPIGARVTVTEQLDAAQTALYDVTARFGTTSVTGNEIRFTVPKVNDYAEFTNTRKLATITLRKQLIGASDLIYFTATVTDGSAALTGYNANNFTAGVRNVQLSNGGSVELKIPMGATLQLAETHFRTGSETPTAISTANYVEPTITYSVGPDAASFTPDPATYSAALANVTGDGEILFANTRLRKLTVSKTAVGGEDGKNYSFTIYNVATGAYSYVIYTNSTNAVVHSGTLTTDTSNNLTFRLQDGQRIEIMLPAKGTGAYPIHETVYVGYTTTVSVNGETPTEGNNAVESLNEDTRIDYVNEYVLVAPTGFVDDHAAIPPALGLALLLVVLLVIMKRRMDRRYDPDVPSPAVVLPPAGEDVGAADR